MEKLNNLNLGLLFIRIALAAVFVSHGIAKFLDISGTTSFFASLGLGEFFVYFIALVELLGGLAILLGLWTQWAAAIIAVDMLFAIFLVKFSAGFFGGWEFDLVLLLAALAMVFAGPGDYSARSLLKES